MTQSTIILAAAMVAAFATSTFADPTSIVASGATLQQAGSGYSFTEGPAADKAGNVYFTDQPNDKILKWSVDGTITTFLTPCGRSNGLCVDHHGDILACADGHNELWRIDKHGKSTVLVKDYQSKLLDGPNDVWERPDGGVYFTDPWYQRPYWHRGPEEQTTQGVYYLSPKGDLTRVVDDMTTPNGIIGTADGKTLYVADIGASKTYAYDIEKDGSLKGKRLFCSMGSDGMTIDDHGDVYLTGRGVTVFDSTGQQIDHIDVPQGWTANICFAGKEHDMLFITASNSVYTLKTTVHGVGSQ